MTTPTEEAAWLADFNPDHLPAFDAHTQAALERLADVCVERVKAQISEDELAAAGRLLADVDDVDYYRLAGE